MPFDLSVVVPAYNEAKRIAATLQNVQEYLDARNRAGQIIVCADGTDGTRERAAEAAKNDPRITVLGSAERRGKGRGVREGILRGQGAIIGFVDADGKTSIEELDALLPHFEEGADLVIGSRKMAGSTIDAAQPLYRRAGSAAFHAIVMAVMGLGNIRDTQCGFKFFRREVAHRLFSLQRIDGYMFDVEILRLARRLRYRIDEVPVRWRDDGDSRYDPVRGTIRNARELLRIRVMKYGVDGQPPLGENSCVVSIRPQDASRSKQ